MWIYKTIDLTIKVFRGNGKSSNIWEYILNLAPFSCRPTLSQTGNRLCQLRCHYNKIETLYLILGIYYCITFILIFKYKFFIKFWEAFHGTDINLFYKMTINNTANKRKSIRGHLDFIDRRALTSSFSQRKPRSVKWRLN